MYIYTLIFTHTREPRDLQHYTKRKRKRVCKRNRISSRVCVKINKGVH